MSIDAFLQDRLGWFGHVERWNSDFLFTPLKSESLTNQNLDSILAKRYLRTEVVAMRRCGLEGILRCIFIFISIYLYIDINIDITSWCERRGCRKGEKMRRRQMIGCGHH